MTRAAAGEISVQQRSADRLNLRRLPYIYQELAKARLSSLVLVTTAAGFVLGSTTHLDFALLLWTVLGTGLAAACANTWNQIIEIDRDALMNRTQNRPLPSRQISVLHAAVWGTASGLVGLALLALAVNMLTAVLGLVTILLYVTVYTPLKVRTSLNTIVGAVCGAIPPLMGWTAATGSFGSGGWILAAVLFTWQIPHFLALAWMYREDYRRGGYRMLPVIARGGALTGPVAVLYALALLPVSLVLTLAGVSGSTYALGALLIGCLFLVPAFHLMRKPSDRAARRLFLASIMYLPMVLLLAVSDRNPLSENDLVLQEAALPQVNPLPAEGNGTPVGLMMPTPAEAGG